MKKAPRNDFQPSRSHEPLTGAKGEKLLITTSPVISGTIVSTSKRRHRADREDRLDARGAQDAVVLDVPHGEHDDGADDEHGVDAQRQPVLQEVEIGKRHCHVLMVASAAKKTDSRYPAQRPEPSASTGVHASQLHHSEIGAAGLM